ncbi:MAG: DNA repair protein RecN [Bacteroidales bacterium]|nr:DNA repair protein RecN [Bacteroidales bacterium]
MIQHIRIENYTLIEHLSMDLSDGFTAITGETGAGKSMFIGALSLLMGQRCDTSVLKDKSKKTIVEAVFDIEAYHIESWFEATDLDYSPQCIIRREITPQGKSRAFVNDTPVNANVLRQLTSQLADIHSQHSNLLLQDKNFQLLIVDQYAQLDKELSQYRQLYTQWKQLQADYHAMQMASQSFDRSYIEFLITELDNAHLRQGEQAELEENLPLMQHAQQIEQELSKSVNLIESLSPINILSLMREVKQSMAEVSRFQEQYAEMNKRMQSQLVDMEDIAYELKRMLANIQNNPQEIERMTARLDELYRLEQKHHVADEAELIAVYKRLNAQMEHIVDNEINENRLKQAIAEKYAELTTMACAVSERRKKVLPDIERMLEQRLKTLNMPDAQVRILMHTTDELSSTGKDNPVFMFNVNKGMELQEVAKIASGGELSRLMLAIKSLIISKNVLPTIIFDEIDSGVSGEVSAKMGAMMKQISAYCQVISITHLPQVAAKADRQMLIYKYSTTDSTVTQIKPLTHQERVEELAKMISDENVSSAAIQTAKNLLEN